MRSGPASAEVGARPTRLGGAAARAGGGQHRAGRTQRVSNNPVQPTHRTRSVTPIPPTTPPKVQQLCPTRRGVGLRGFPKLGSRLRLGANERTIGGRSELIGRQGIPARGSALAEETHAGRPHEPSLRGNSCPITHRELDESTHLSHVLAHKPNRVRIHPFDDR